MSNCWSLEHDKIEEKCKLFWAQYTCKAYNVSLVCSNISTQDLKQASITICKTQIWIYQSCERREYCWSIKYILSQTRNWEENANFLKRHGLFLKVFWSEHSHRCINRKKKKKKNFEDKIKSWTQRNAQTCKIESKHSDTLHYSFSCKQDSKWWFE